MATDMEPPSTPPPEFSAEVMEQVDDLAEIHGHITSVIANLDIDPNWFDGYDDPKRAKYELDGVVQVFLYQHACEFNQTELQNRLKGAAFVYVRFGLPDPMSQQTISQNWKYRLSLTERRAIETVAEHIREVCLEHDLIGADEPALEPEDVANTHGLGEELIQDAVGRATELGFDEFPDPRASNAKYPLESFFERQGFLHLSGLNTTQPRRMFARASDREEVPHGSTHNRTMKKVGNPDPQTSLENYEDGRRPLDWKRIRDAILPAFHAGVEKQLDEIAGRDRQGIREPVMAALDIVTFNFWPSPFEHADGVSRNGEPLERKNGQTVYPKEDYPEVVSGFKDSNKEKAERGYKFATLTIVAEDTPLVIAVEPVRDQRWWEREDDTVDVERTPRADVVERLLEQAEQHVDIHKVFCDREFDGHAVGDVIDRRTIQYVIGKRKNSNQDFESIEEIIESPVYDTRIEHAIRKHDGREHKVSIIYLPQDSDTDDNDDYSLFVLNGWVDSDRAEALTEQYRHRWEVENEYKTIKKNFLPPTASKDYRVRFLYFIIAVILYNVWRLANFVLRDEVSVHLGETPPLRAWEIVQLVSRFLFDPGD